MGNTYLYKGFKAMMSRIVLTISAVSAYKPNKNLINEKTGKGQTRPQYKYDIPQPLQHGSTEIQPLATHLQWCAVMVLGVGAVIPPRRQGKARRAIRLASCMHKTFLARRYDQVDHSSHLGAKTQFDGGYYTDLSTAQPLHSATS